MIKSKLKKAKKSLLKEAIPHLEASKVERVRKSALESVSDDEGDFLQEIEKATAGPLQRNEDISSYIQNNPSMTAQLIRAWLTEG